MDTEDEERFRAQCKEEAKELAGSPFGVRIILLFFSTSPLANFVAFRELSFSLSAESICKFSNN